MSRPPAHKVIPTGGASCFVVDGFQFAQAPQVAAWFLTHAHSDHYTGLKPRWNAGPIYCSDVTAALVEHLCGVGREWLRVVPMDTPTGIEGVEVTLVDANHCPGAVQLLFRLPDGRKFVHTGDMRYSSAMLNNPHLSGFMGCDALYLDTTYCHPRYTFPPQEETIQYLEDTIYALMQPEANNSTEQEQQQQQQQQGGSSGTAAAALEEWEGGDSGDELETALQAEDQSAGPEAMELGQQQEKEQEGKEAEEGRVKAEAGGDGEPGAATKARGPSRAPVAAGARRFATPAGAPSRLFLISTYGVGKERILTAVRARCGVRLHVSERKLAVMRCLDLAGYSADELFTTDPGETPVHVVQWGLLGETWPFFRPNFVNMERIRQQYGVDEVVGFVPTGWLYELKKHTFSVRRKGACSVHLLPYSEHSSFSELLEYVGALRPHKVVPTVGVSGEDAERSAAKMVRHFRHLVDETASKAKFLAAFHRASSGGANGSSHGGGGGGVAGASGAGRPGSCGGDCGSAPAAGGSGPGALAEVEEGAELPGAEADVGLGGEGLQGAAGGSEPSTSSRGASSAGAGRRKRPRPTSPPSFPAEPAEGEESGERAEQEVISLLDDSDEEPAAAQQAQHAQQQERQQRAGAGAGASADSPQAAPPAAVQLQHAQQDSGAPMDADSGDGAGPSCAAGGTSPSQAAELEGLSHLQAVLGGSMALGEAKQLLVAAGMDAQRAINMKLDGWAPGKLGTGGSVGGAAATAGGRGLGGGGSRSGGAEKQADKSPGGPSKGSSRGTAAAAGGTKGSKRQKAAGGVAPGQRSILSFFGGPRTAPTGAAAAAQPSPPGRVAAAAAAAGQPPAVRHVVNASDTTSADLVPALPAGPSPAPVSLQQSQHAAAAGAPAAAGPAAQPEASPGPGPDPGPSPSKPKLVLPKPPSRGSPGLLSGASGLGTGSQRAQQGVREAQVPKDAVTLPLDKYEPVAHAPWVAGQPTPYLHLARAFEAADATTKRLRISDVLVNAFRSVLALAPGDLVAFAYLATGRVAPDYEGVELNVVGGSTVAAAIQEATGVSKARLGEMYTALGDLGDVAQACKRTQAVLQQPAPLTVQGVLGTLRALAAEQGKGAAGRRQRTVLGLLRSCRESEPKYLVRTLVRALRVGANWRSVIPALAKAVLLHQEGPRVPKARLDAAGAAATAAFHVCPNLERLVEALLAGPPEGVEERCALTPGVPIKPMLAKISEGAADAVRQLKGSPFLAEFKYDGMRAQIHLLPGGQVRVFSRNCEDKSASYPDVAHQIREAAQNEPGGACGDSTLILDAEVVAVERDDEGGAPRIRAFQELATRARGDVELAKVSVQVCVFVFDVLYAGGASLLRLPLRERRQRLLQSLPGMRPGYVALAQSYEIHPADYRACPPAAARPAAGRSSAAGMGGGEGLPMVAEEETALGGPAESRGASGGADGSSEMGLGPGASGQRGPPQRVDGGQGTAPSHAPSPEAPPAPAVLPPAPAAALAAAGGGGTGAGSGAVEALEQRVQGALLEAFAAGTEGLMLKSLEACYEPSRRSEHWVKLKRDYCEGLHDTVDLVPIGAWYGNGRKAGWYSPFLLAVYDPQAEELQSLCRCMSGFSDAFYREATARLEQTIIPGPRPYYNTGEAPDVWFDAREVWEIRGADLTLSPVHRAAVGRLHPERGVGLRFPRFLRIREDKAPEDASSADLIVQLYSAQTRKVEDAGRRLAARVGAAAAAATAAEAEAGMDTAGGSGRRGREESGSGGGESSAGEEGEDNGADLGLEGGIGAAEEDEEGFWAPDGGD